jgi:glutamate/tyrosine decarboxylase-like PLP-dependent enzyme
MKDSMNEEALQEETLDPQDWAALRALAHNMVDDMLTYLETVRERPVWQPVPDEVKSFLNQPLPDRPQSPEEIYREFQENILPYPMGNIHPRFWGWVMGNGTPLGALAELLAATMNPNMGGGNHGGVYVERQVTEWCKAMLTFPEQASGLLVSGGSQANLVGLAVARNSLAGYDLRRQGVGASPNPLVLYGSSEMHSSIQKAVELMGLGSEALRKIPVDSEYRIDLAELKRSIAADRASGCRPFCVVGNAGTVNTGAIDDLEALAGLCAREGLWFHIDGAFGALAWLSPELRPLLKGMELADSLAFDLHKWLYLPFEAGCILVRREADHRRAFSLTPEYLAHGGERGLASGSMWFSDYGIQLTRGFRALKIWMSFKEHGIEKFGRMIHQNVKQARYLASRVKREPELELVAPAPLNIVCFRYHPQSFEGTRLNELNQELLVRLHESGIAVPSYTTLNGTYALRAAITNHRSRLEDFDILVDAVLRLGRELVDGS